MAQLRKHKSLRASTPLILFAILMLIFAVLFRYRAVVAEEKLAQYEVTYPIKLTAVGEVLDTKRFSFAVNNVEFDDIGIPELPAQSGSTYVMVSLSIHNKTNQPINFLPIFDTYIADEQGNRYEVSVAPRIEAASIAGVIGPGVASHGSIGYTVPLTASGLSFTYEPRAFPDANIIRYDINR